MAKNIVIFNPMDRKSLWMRQFSLGIFLLLIFFSGTLSAQFEQKLSLNVSAGYFKTLGWDGWEENWEEHGPSLMPNFKGGPSFTAGLQYNFSRHFSVEFQLGYRYAPSWYFDASPEGEEAHNYLHFEIYDEATSTVLAAGENYMDLNNVHLGIAPRFYFIPGSRLNPFVYAGLNLNYTDVYFDNVELQTCESEGWLDLYEENPELVNWFEYNVGIGFMAGVGVEYVINDSWGIFVMASYHFISLNDKAFFKDSYLMNYHDLEIQLGARFSLLKSKTL